MSYHGYNLFIIFTYSSIVYMNSFFLSREQYIPTFFL
nr:MAG TPA: hypothetical protein [Caudoviricetes sp.]